MKVKCDYCDNYIDETDEQCPYCGAPNAHMTRSGNGEPKTIEELLAFAQAHNLPLERMRFFIGQDYREPRAFGIYRDPEDGNFVVYKNKANGERVIRYRGDDEAFAVNEIYQKMRAELLDRKERMPAGGGHRGGSGTGLNQAFVIGVVTVVAILVIAIVLSAIADSGGSRRGYYDYDDTYYYYDNGWYRYDDGWSRDYSIPGELEDNSDSYYDGDSYSDVGDSSVDPYVSDRDDNSSWNSDDWDDNDWDFDSSWDSGDTDWDSDWRIVFIMPDTYICHLL